MERFVGKWKMESSEHFDDYMKAIGVGMVMRKLAATAKPSYNIIDEGDGLYNLRTETTFKTTDLRFRVGEEFAETTGDGRKMTTTVTIVGGSKMIQDQKGDPPSVITRELTDDNTLVCICEAKDVKCTRVYKRA